MNIVKDFVSTIKEYINLIDEIENMSANEFLSQCAILLPQIYHIGIRLPEVEADNKEDIREGSDIEYSGEVILEFL